jgi:hypothetical protein
MHFYREGAKGAKKFIFWGLTLVGESGFLLGAGVREGGENPPRTRRCK